MMQDRRDVNTRDIFQERQRDPREMLNDRQQAREMHAERRERDSSREMREGGSGGPGSRDMMSDRRPDVNMGIFVERRDGSKERRPVKVWNANRNIKKALVVGSYEEFLKKGRK